MWHRENSREESLLSGSRKQERGDIAASDSESRRTGVSRVHGRLARIQWYRSGVQCTISDGESQAALRCPRDSSMYKHRGRIEFALKIDVIPRHRTATHADATIGAFVWRKMNRGRLCEVFLEALALYVERN